MKGIKYGLFIFLSMIYFVGLPGNTLAADNPYRHINVDLENQMFYALEGDQLVYQTPISSGLEQSPTVRGTYHIYWKLPYDEMKGTSPVHGYYDLPNVPNVMYFYEGYAIHGAYWHNNFGHPMSNGCVNVPIPASAWLYDFANQGTSVSIY